MMHRVLKTLVVVLGSVTVSLPAQATISQAGRAGDFKPTVGQAGKDVIWVPTPPELVEAMLNIAKVQRNDVLIDLGSGDGRTVVAAARRGASALGIEYNPDMIELSRRNAREAGVAKLAIFEQADIFATDFSRADVLTLFLLPSLNLRLRPTILEMRPGTRVVSNTFPMDEWEPDETITIENCAAWCTALLWIVPATVAGTWDLGGQRLEFSQEFQMLAGALGTEPIKSGRVRGEEIYFVVGGTRYEGRISGETMSGIIKGVQTAKWTATKK